MFSKLWQNFRTPLLVTLAAVIVLVWILILNPLLSFISTTVSSIDWAMGWIGIVAFSCVFGMSITAIIKKLRNGPTIETSSGKDADEVSRK